MKHRVGIGLVLLVSIFAYICIGITVYAQEEKFIPFGSSTFSSLSVSQEEQIEAKKIKASEKQFTKRDYDSDYRLKLEFPGGYLSKSDDYGLLKGLYDVISLVSGKKVQTKNINGNANSGKLGEPNLSFANFKVRLPDSTQKSGISVRIENADYVELDGLYNIAPIQEALFESFRPGVDKDNRTFRRKDEIYKKNTFFSHPMEYNLAVMHGVKIFELSISPFQYNPVTKKIKVAKSLELVINYNVGTINNVESIISSELVDPIIDSQCFNADTSLESLDTSFQSSSYGPGSKFVIVSKSNLINTQTYTDYINYRKNQGYVHLETIDTSNTAFDTVSEIVSRLQILYQNLGFDYLILIGDETIVPISYLTTQTGTDGEIEYLYHDKKYCWLDPPTNTDDIPDVAMGRFLCRDETGFRNILNHQKAQEAGGAWSYDVMMTWGIEHYYDDPNIADRFASGHYSTLAMDWPNFGLGYTVHRFYQKANSSNPAPKKYGGMDGVPLSNFESWVLTPTPFCYYECQANIISQWNEGVALIGHRDHGITQGPYNPAIRYDMFSGQLSSDSSPLFTATDCLSGNYRGNHSTNFAYQSQVRLKGTSSTLAATTKTNSGDNDNYHLAMYQAMFPIDGSTPIRNVGQIFYEGVLGAWQGGRARKYFHIFGDPMTTLSLGGELDSTPPYIYGPWYKQFEDPWESLENKVLFKDTLIYWASYDDVSTKETIISNVSYYKEGFANQAVTLPVTNCTIQYFVPIVLPSVTFPAATLAEGSYILNIQLTDKAGNNSTPYLIPVTVNRRPPTLEYLEYSPPAYPNGTTLVNNKEFSSSTNYISFEIRKTQSAINTTGCIIDGKEYIAGYLRPDVGFMVYNKGTPQEYHLTWVVPKVFLTTPKTYNIKLFAQDIQGNKNITGEYSIVVR